MLSPELKEVLEEALTDYIGTATSKLSTVGFRYNAFKSFLKDHEAAFPELPLNDDHDDRQKLGSLLRDFFFMRPTIYDAEKIRAGVVSVSGLRPLWVDSKLNVVGMSE